MAHLTIPFIEVQLTLLKQGKRTEEQICKTIENVVLEALCHDRQESDNEAMLKAHFDALGRHYAHLADQDEINNRQ